MSNALGAVLQGLERGAGMGLNMYKALNEESRAKRQEQFQISRAIRQDFESDRSHDYTVGRAETLDGQWERNFEEGTRQFNANLDISQRQTAVQERNAATQEGNLALGNRRFQYGVDEAERVRNETQILTRANASLYGPDGQRLTGQALVERLNSDPQAMKDIMNAAVVKGLIPEERAGRYSGMRVVPMGDSGNFGIMVAGKTEDGSPIPAGGAPLTENGTTSPDDQVMVFNPDSLGMMLDPEGHRSTMRDNALIQMDSQEEIDAFEKSYQQNVQSLDAQQEAMEKQLKESKAKLSELEANRIPVPASRLSEEELAASRLTGGGLGGFGHGGLTTRNSAKGHAWEAEHAQATQALEQAQMFLDAAPNRREQLEGIRTSSLADIAAQAGRDRIEPGYTERRRDRQVKATEAGKAAVEAGNKTIDAAVKAQNAHGKAVFGDKFDKHLNPNEVRTEFGRLHPDVRRRLVAAPGGLEAAVTVMGSMGVTSFDYIIDAMDSQVHMDSYKNALQDPALVSATGGNADEMHALAKAFAHHMAQNPNAPTSSVLLALTQGKEPPKGK